MTEFAKFNGQNAGGFQQIQYLLPSDISSFTIGTGYKIYLTFVQGKNWRDIYITPKSFSGAGTSEPSPSGDIYKYQFSCRHPKDSATLITDLANIQATGVMLRVKDGNGIVRIYGTPLNPMTVKSKLLLPGEVQNYNGYEITFELISPDPAYIPSA